MAEIFLLLLVVATIAVAWIEWVPQRYAIFTQILCALSLIPVAVRWMPYWHGWVTLFISTAVLAWTYFSPKRRKEWPDLYKLSAARKTMASLAGSISATIAGFRHRYSTRAIGEEVCSSNALHDHAQQTSTHLGAKIRIWFGTAGIFLLSPLSAIPWLLALVLALTAGDAISGTFPASHRGVQDVATFILGRTFVTEIATLDVMLRYAYLSVPVFLAVAYAVSQRVLRLQSTGRRYLTGVASYGVLYPLVFLAAEVFDAFEGPLYN